MHRLVALIAVVAALVALPATALAQDNPFLPDSGQSAPRQNTPPPPAPVEDRSDDSDLGAGTVVAIGLAVVALIGGIWFAITRDARTAAGDERRAHTARTEPDAAARATPGSRGRHATRSGSRGRKLSKREQARRKRGRAR